MSDEKAELKRSCERLKETLGKEFGEAIEWAYREGLLRKGPYVDVEKLAVAKRPSRSRLNGHPGEQS